MFGFGVTTYLLSKEIWVIEHDFGFVIAFGLLIWGANKKFGKQIKEATDKMVDVSVSVSIQAYSHFILYCMIF